MLVLLCVGVVVQYMDVVKGCDPDQSFSHVVLEEQQEACAEKCKKTIGQSSSLLGNGSFAMIPARNLLLGEIAKWACAQMQKAQ